LFDSLPRESAHYAAMLNTSAALLVEEGRYREAKECYLRALEKVGAAFGRNADYAQVCGNIKRVCFALGEREEGMAYLREETELLEHIFGGSHPRAAAARGEQEPGGTDR